MQNVLQNFHTKHHRRNSNKQNKKKRVNWNDENNKYNYNIKVYIHIFFKLNYINVNYGKKTLI